MIHPNVSMDVDRRYRVRDVNIHAATDFTAYTLFSLWDPFRALHPLYEIIVPDRNVDFITSMLAGYQQPGMLPVWELASYETGTLVDYHSVPVFDGASLSGNGSFDRELDFEGWNNRALVDHI